MVSYMIHYGKLKAYDDGDCSLLIYKEPRVKSPYFVTIPNHNLSPSISAETEEDEKLKNMYRVRRKLFDYAKNNQFDYFWTLTFDSNFDDNDERMRAARLGKDFRYIFVPELHKSGLLHFHGVSGGYCPELVYSGHKFKNTRVYNCVSFEAGFTNVQMVRSKAKISRYITKYITKDLMNSPVRKNKKKYWCSKNLTLPREYAWTKDFVPDVEPAFDSDICSIYNFTKEEAANILHFYQQQYCSTPSECEDRGTIFFFIFLK